MNAWMGGADGGFSRLNWIQFENRSQFSSLPPSQAMVFIGERTDSINDTALYISMNGYQDSTTLSDLSLLVDYPSFYHGGGASVSFADGHVIRKIWQDPRTIPAYSPEKRLQLNIPSPQNPDVLWIQDHATRRF
jgi:prepilin-type processing-associated H-X9-DG protein